MSKWIRSSLKEALYWRGGFQCVYCQTALTLRTATLDHLIPRDVNGPNTPHNLVVCCHTCNSSRGKTDWIQWVTLRFAMTFPAVVRRVYTQRRQRITKLRSAVQRADAVLSAYDAVMESCEFCTRPCRACLEAHVAPWRPEEESFYLYPEEW